MPSLIVQVKGLKPRPWQEAAACKKRQCLRTSVISLLHPPREQPI